MVAGDDQPAAARASARAARSSGHCLPTASITRSQNALAGELLHALDDGPRDRPSGSSRPRPVRARDRARTAAARSRSPARRHRSPSLVRIAPRKPMPTIATVCPGRDVAAAEDVQRAAERLARERLPGQRVGQRHHRVRVGDVVFGVSCGRRAPRPGRRLRDPSTPSPTASTSPSPRARARPARPGKCIHSGPAQGSGWRRRRRSLPAGSAPRRGRARAPARASSASRRARPAPPPASISTTFLFRRHGMPERAA